MQYIQTCSVMLPYIGWSSPLLRKVIQFSCGLTPDCFFHADRKQKSISLSFIQLQLTTFSYMAHLRFLHIPWGEIAENAEFPQNLSLKNDWYAS